MIHNPLFLRGSDRLYWSPITVSDSGLGHVNTWKEVINGRKEI
jgi:hypothetical protein